jgi:YidC/Oxa1 family membrane protein insertase
MEKDQRNALLAVILSAIVLVGWQYINPEKRPTTFGPSANNANEVVTSAPQTSSANPTPVVAVAPIVTASETMIESEGWKIRYLSDLTFEVLQSPAAADLSKTIFGDKTHFKIEIPSAQGQLFNMTSKSSMEYNFASADGKSSFSMFLSKDFLKFTQFLPGSPRFIIKTDPSFEESMNLKKFVYLTDSYDYFESSKNETAENVMQWIGLDFQYHYYGFVFPTKTFVQFFGNAYQLNVNPKVDTGDQVLFGFFTKDYDRLKALGHNLHRTVDFGMFSFLAIPILWLLKKFYFFGDNYGLAIILLTLLIRLITFPLQFSSLKGMKRMQKLQPEIQKIKDRYKDDPVSMQRETMDLFKRHKVNPLSGCFPLLLQMPVFFALYSVLYNSVELLHAPFYFWITDLSLKDPYYVLPVLMTASMFMQQKITPSTITDKMQARIMLFMPIIFGFFMKDLPSGLNLYIFVSTMAGIVQQVVVFNRIKT